MILYTFDKRLQKIINELAEKHKIHPDDAAEMINQFEGNTREFMKKQETIRVPNIGLLVISQKKKKLKELKTKLKQEQNENNTK